MALRPNGGASFLEDRNTKSQRFYRIANEVPTVLMIHHCDNGYRATRLILRSSG